MKNHAYQFLSFLMLFFFSNNIFSQKNCIECHNIFNQIDRIFLEKDTATALHLYESINAKKCMIPKGRYTTFGAIYYNLGEFEKSKEQLRKAVENGFLEWMKFIEEDEGYLKFIKKRYGEIFLTEIITLNDRLAKENEAKYGAMTSELKAIYEADQALRKVKKYKDCKSYNFKKRLGFPVDSTKNETEIIACFEEFRHKDSVLLQRFVDIVDSLGFVPDDKVIFGKFPIGPVINHTAHFEFKKLDSLYLHSLKIGTLAPKTYAWYQGYQEEYFLREHQLYFTHGEAAVKALSAEEIEVINRRRLALGVPVCPAVIWNVKRY